MLASKSRHNLTSQAAQDTYICLSCRLKSQQRLRLSHRRVGDGQRDESLGETRPSPQPEKSRKPRLKETGHENAGPLSFRKQTAPDWGIRSIETNTTTHFGKKVENHCHPPEDFARHHELDANQHGETDVVPQTKSFGLIHKHQSGRLQFIRTQHTGLRLIGNTVSSKGQDPIQKEAFDTGREKATSRARRIFHDSRDGSADGLQRVITSHLEAAQSEASVHLRQDGSDTIEPRRACWGILNRENGLASVGVSEAKASISVPNRDDDLPETSSDRGRGITHVSKALNPRRVHLGFMNGKERSGSARRFAWQSTTDPPSTSQKRTFFWSSIGEKRGSISPRIMIAQKRANIGYATAATAAVENEDSRLLLSQDENPHGIRAQLRKWQESHGHEDPVQDDIPMLDDYLGANEPINNLTRLPDESSIRRRSQQDEEDKEAYSHFAEVGQDDLDGSARSEIRFIKMGDLVELAFNKTERESQLAVFVRDIPGSVNEGQFFTMNGRWMHVNKSTVQYSIPGWVSPKLVESLLKHLPSPEEALKMQELKEKAYMEDLSVPRNIAAPLVKRMLNFYNESQEIYRRHANVLDNAHSLLAHDTDLRYGSIMSAATTLLNTPSDELPLTALFTVRKALSNAGFAFNTDRRSHRLTGYIQIRSKDQVKMVDQVRSWLRQWQEDLASRAGKDENQLSRHKPSKGAQTVYSFLEKAKAIVVHNRKNRQPTESNNVGPSKIRLSPTENAEVVKVETRSQFTHDEQEIVRFLEAWCCSNMFDGLPRIQSLPPLLVQATGLYDNDMIGVPTGFMFLQELGTIMPYENRVRFDQHLLLPSSQHSRPLQNLMSSLINMKDNHNFQDSMAALRHDWKDLPVYCIDNLGALEIDDGISIQEAGTGVDGSKQYWVHVHVANPTAFFSRDHPLAKMARHMGETIYMPERTYMMLPRWATNRHFSLAPNRPCLTFSAKLDSEGNTLERKITPGIVRNVMQLTPQEVRSFLGAGKDDQSEELVLTVGGDYPSPNKRKSHLNDRSESMIADLRKLGSLASKRADIRKRAGGVFFNSEEPVIEVRQNAKVPGLAWDHPYRKGSRTVLGDPLIELRTRGLRNWFAPSQSTDDNVLVRECMLLACEIAASWCAEREIPIIYRGTVRDPAKPDPKRYLQEVVEPATKSDGSYPMHVGLSYISTIGLTVLRTQPRRHDMLGMDYYTKITSPLRRYGDMIMHWQIEAALRHEAETGRSLIATAKDRKPDRSFLPFSAPIIDTIMLGLQPRERLITASKRYANQFWQAMLIFRKHHFKEDGGLPFKAPGSLSDGTNGLRPMTAFVHNEQAGIDPMAQVFVIMMELNVYGSMINPETMGMEKPRRGDVWEVEMEKVDMYTRNTVLKPVRLIGREGAGIL